MNPSIWTPDNRKPILPLGGVWSPDRRIVLPGQLGYDELTRMEASRIGTPGSMSGGMQSLSGVETGLYGANGIPAPPGTPIIWCDSRQGLFSDTSLTTPQTTDGGVVKGWKDFSGNSNSPVLPGTANALVLKTNILHSNINIVRSSVSTPDNALSKSFTWNQTAHLFIVYQQRAWANGKYVLDGFTGDVAALLMRTSSPNVGMFAGAHGPQNSDLALNTWGIFYMKWAGASSSSKVNAGTAQTGNASTSNPGGITLGAHGGTNGGGSGTSTDVDFACVLGYTDSSGAPLGTTETAVRNYLNTQFTIF